MKYRLFLILLPLLAVSCSSGSAPDDETLSALGFSVINTDMDTPVVSFLDETGNERNLEEFRGSVVLLNFWATWCPPCLAEMPSMSELNSKLEKLDFEMVAVSVAESPDLVARFVEEFDIDFPVYTDPEGMAAGTFGISAIPTTLILDRKGNARAVIQGAYEWDRTDIVDMFKDWCR